MRHVFRTSGGQMNSGRMVGVHEPGKQGLMRGGEREDENRAQASSTVSLLPRRALELGRRRASRPVMDRVCVVSRRDESSRLQERQLWAALHRPHGAEAAFRIRGRTATHQSCDWEFWSLRFLYLKSRSLHLDLLVDGGPAWTGDCNGTGG